MKTLVKNFMKCGTIGWCMEILFTACNSIRRRDPKLTGITYIWMFPIYGLACLIAPFYRLIHSLHWCVRGLLYMLLFFCGEYTTGRLLQKYDLCPWDYSNSDYHIRGIIRLDYAPCWFIAGLLYEKLLGASCKDVS